MTAPPGTSAFRRSVVPPHRLVRNSLWSLAGQLGPLLVAVLAVPVLIRQLGVERFGILTLAWTAIGYFSLFDLGLGRALTRSLSAALGGGREDELPSLTRGALAAMIILGLVGSAIFAALTPWIVDRALSIPDGLRSESRQSFYLLCASLPFVLATAGIRGVFEAHQEFGIATALRVPYAIFNFVAPLAVLPFSHSLVPVVGILVVGRITTCVAHWIVARKRFAFLNARAAFDRNVLVPLFQTGGWMTVSNIVSPLMANFDRFVVGALLSVTAVAYYATPYDMITKLMIVPSALLGVLFPAFSATIQRDRGETALLLDRTLRTMVLAIFPPVLLLVAFAHEGMRLWLGADFAAQSAVVVRWLAAGVLINSVGQIAFAIVQGAGRADLTAKLHVAELPFYAVALFVLTKWLGIAGVAIAWTARVAIDTIVLFVFSAGQLPEGRGYLRRAVATMGALLAGLTAVTMVNSAWARVAVVATLLVLFGLVEWRNLLRSSLIRIFA